MEQTIRRYQNRAIEAAQVIEELIGLARELREAGARGEALGLSDDELAFYDALSVNDSAVEVLGDETLCGIARDLVTTVRRNVTIDWTLRENVRATSAGSSSASYGSTAIRPTSKKPPPGRCSSRLRRSRPPGRRDSRSGIDPSIQLPRLGQPCRAAEANQDRERAAASMGFAELLRPAAALAKFAPPFPCSNRAFS